MDKLCRGLPPDFRLTSSCVSWLRQATEHCTTVIQRTDSFSEVWSRVTNLIFPEEKISVLNLNNPIGIHPQRLSPSECHSLLLHMTNDYILRGPRCSAAEDTIALQTQILNWMIGLLSVGCLFVVTSFFYRQFDRMFHCPRKTKKRRKLHEKLMKIE